MGSREMVLEPPKGSMGIILTAWGDLVESCHTREEGEG